MFHCFPVAASDCWGWFNACGIYRRMIVPVMISNDSYNNIILYYTILCYNNNRVRTIWLG